MFVSVKVTPKAKLNKVIQINDAHFAIQTTAAPDKGKANQSAIKLLAKHLSLPRSSFAIVKGQTSRQKLIKIN